MTVDAAAVERWARALGVWERFAPFGLKITNLQGLTLVTREPKHCVSRSIDPLTAAMFLIGHARGLRVDVGECPACPPAVPPEDAPTPMMDTPAKRGEQRKYTRSRPRGKGWKDSRQWGAFEFAVPYWWRLCPDCEASGRHTLTWEAAIIAAMPRDQSGLTSAVRASSSKRYLASFDGDATTREALAVIADAMQASGDVLGDLVTAWLRGECPMCKGSGRRDTPYTSSDGGRVAHWSQCSACRGHGSVLGGFERKLAQAIEAELGRMVA